MKNYLKVVAGFFIVAFVISCSADNNNGNQAPPIIIPRLFEVKKIDCESTVELCNRKPGLKFTALAPHVEDNRPNWNLELRVRYEPDPYTLTICCDSIPGLIDSLNMMFGVLENYRRDKPEREGKTCHLPDSITISVCYVKNLSSAGDYSSLEFGKVADGSIFYVYTKEQFDKLIQDINERFRTCCLN